MIDLSIPSNSRACFGELYCRKYHCGESEFLGRFFWSCVRRRALFIAALQRLFSLKSLNDEWSLMMELWRARTMTEVDEAIYFYRGLRAGERAYLSVRLSTSRARRMARLVFAEFGQN